MVCELHLNKTYFLGTSLAVQWLRLHLPMQGVRVQSLVRELRSHMLHGQKNKTKKKKRKLLFFKMCT